MQDVERLVKFCERRDQFANDANLQQALGPLFAGMSTDWEQLNRLIEFAVTLRNDLGLEKAREILSHWEGHVERMKGCDHALSRIVQEAEEFADTHPFPSHLWQRPVHEVIGTLSPWIARIELAVQTISQPWCASDASLRECIDTVALYRTAKEQERAIEQSRNFEVLLSRDWRGPETPIDALRLLQDWLETSLNQTGIDLPLLRTLFHTSTSLDTDLFEQLVEESTRFNEHLSGQIRNLEKYGTVVSEQWCGGPAVTLVEFEEKLSACKDSTASVSLMARWQFVRSQVCEIGLENLADAVAADQLNGRQCSQVFEYSVYSKILDSRVEAIPILRSFGSERFDALRERFASHDLEVLRLTADEIASNLCRAHIPEGVGRGRVRDYSQRRLIDNEVRKKSRHIPLRQLIRRSGAALQALKPCFLMSPLSVAQFLPPGEIKFDLVVMDEASQIRPEDALGAIARATTAIIVGDPKQLPPTSFFDTAIAEDEDAEETILDDTESILDVCLKQFPFRRLRWHYRSQHEDLIRFSNEEFYDNDLIVFPSPKGNSREYGVHSNFVEKSSYRSGRNRGEANVVVASIVHHFKTCSDRSLGVAAMNKRQAEEIELLLDKQRQEDPDLDRQIAEANPPLFIKNLENVQGDERDVIFISATYGPPDGEGENVFQRFGPINSDLGWRRLNVIATRAKQRVELFTSMRPSQVLVGGNVRRGVRALRSYLEYAETGRVLDHGSVTGRAPESEFEEAVGAIITNLGYQVEPQVGVQKFFIDLGVRHPDRPGEFLMGIECDGATYHSSRSVRDRDRLRQSILEDKGWHIHRIWSTSWFHTRAAEIERLERALSERLEQDRRVTTIEAPPVAREDLAEDLAAEIESQEDREDESLSAALDRFWKQNIESQFTDRASSILSEAMVRILVKHRPETEDRWFGSIPIKLRQAMDRNQRGFLEDILDLIAEYS